MTTAVDHGNQSALTLREIALAELHESPHNPRRHYDEAALQELADSIRAAGILNPLIVRPNKKGYEIAAGHRRYRAGKLAKKEVAPCIVREMTDEQFMEVITIENLQRKDVHPLDEAYGYEAMMAAPYRWKEEVIAKKVGKSVEYIHDTIKLLKLTPDAQRLFWDGQIEKGHAVLLARLLPAEQGKVIGAKKDYSDGGLFEEEHRLYGREDGGDSVKARSVAEVAAWIKRHIRFKVKQADPFLFPETVKQVEETVEAKRKIIEITREYIADQDVRRASVDRVYGERAWKRADGKEGSKVCERSVLGAVVSGPGQGEAFQVCINKDRCTVHWGADVKARQKRAQLDPDSQAGRTEAAKAEKRRKLEQEAAKQNEERRKQWKVMLPKIRAVVMERVKALPVDADSVLADLIVRRVNGYGPKLKPSIARGKSAEDLIRHAAAIVLLRELSEWHAHQEFPKLAKQLGVDLSPFVKLEKEKAKKGQGA